jgi:cytochrome P450
MALYPEVQTKAQEELDRVLGSNKFPTFEDRHSLPYIDAIVKESLRWHPVAPMGIPHMCSEDDVYKGYRIPKGSLVMPNIWYGTPVSGKGASYHRIANHLHREFTHDPETYKDPRTFNPSRFLSPTPEMDPRNLSFGFGRRICPGRLLADSTIFMTIAKSLAVFDIQPDGEDSVGEEFLPGVISHPAPFRLRITPRSEVAEGLVRAIEREIPWGKGDRELIEGVNVEV